jgi:hypothetical protein
MRKTTITLFILIIAIPLLFWSVRGLLQNSTVYFSTLGTVSTNYEIENNQYNGKIIKADKPFISIEKNNTYNWDGAFYSILRDSMYAHTNIHPDRLAFFPLYPMVLKIIPRRSPVVFAFNYLLFAVGIILIALFSFSSFRINFVVLTLGLILPASIMFYIPYAESLLVLTFAIAIMGIYKGNYWLYYAGILAFSMTRPTVFVFVMALVATDISYLFQHRNIRYFIKEFLLKVAPCVLGFGIVFIMQYLYRGTLTGYFDTNDIWQTETGFFGNEISDWSLEGFGMNTFAIFFILLPCMIYSVIWVIRNTSFKEKKIMPTLFTRNILFAKDYMFILSVFFMVGNLAMLVFTSGGALNGYSRYTMAVPFFYIILFQLPERLSAISLKIKICATAICLVSISLFLCMVTYAGNLFRFEYSGLYLSVLIFLFLMAESHLSAKTKSVILILLLLPCIIWQTYLFNMYLSNVWIFT